MARYESEHRAERVRRAFLQNAQQGHRAGGPRPFGYEDDGITVREPEAAVESVLAGASLRSVARDLNATGLTTSMKAGPGTRSRCMRCCSNRATPGCGSTRGR